MFLDSDAALTAGALRAMVEAMDAHPAWGLVGPHLVGDEGEHQFSARRFPPVRVSKCWGRSVTDSRSTNPERRF